jgi:hypothetical protein
MIRYWEEDTEKEIGRPFDLEKHDKEISDKWLDKVKEVREEIFENVYRYSGTGDEVLQGYCDGFNYCLKLIDNLLIESEENNEQE